jgi:hypothetical protein
MPTLSIRVDLERVEPEKRHATRTIEAPCHDGVVTSDCTE